MFSGELTLGLFDAANLETAGLILGKGEVDIGLLLLDDEELVKELILGEEEVDIELLLDDDKLLSDEEEVNIGLSKPNPLFRFCR